MIASFDIESTTNETLPASVVEGSFNRAVGAGKMGNFTVDLTSLSFQGGWNKECHLSLKPEINFYMVCL